MASSSSSHAIHADTAVVIGAVVIAGGILYLVYQIEQDTKNAIGTGYEDIKAAGAEIASLPGRAAGAIVDGVTSAYHWLAGDDVSVSSMEYEPESPSGGSEDAGNGETTIP